MSAGLSLAAFVALCLLRQPLQAAELKPTDRAAPSGVHLVPIVCATQVFVQIGAYYWPTLLPV